jgi:hypothetical protein
MQYRSVLVSAINFHVEQHNKQNYLTFSKYIVICRKIYSGKMRRAAKTLNPLRK